MPQFKLNDKFFQELKKVAEEIKKEGYKRVLIQIPDGLKDNAHLIADFLEKEGLEVLIWGGSNWGACDIPLHFKIEKLVDCIIHIGHLPFKKTKYYLQREK